MVNPLGSAFNLDQFILLDSCDGHSFLLANPQPPHPGQRLFFMFRYDLNPAQEITASSTAPMMMLPNIASTP